MRQERNIQRFCEGYISRVVCSEIVTQAPDSGQKRVMRKALYRQVAEDGQQITAARVVQNAGRCIATKD